MLQRSNLISNISPSLLEAAGLSEIGANSLSVGFSAPLGFSLEGDALGGGEVELFMDPAKKRRLQGASASARKPSRRGKGLRSSGVGSLSSTLGKSGRDSLGPLGPEPERPRSAGEWAGGVQEMESPGGSSRGRTRGSVMSSRGGTAKSVELPRIGTASSGDGGMEDGLAGGGVSFEPDLQPAVKLPEIR